ncbi:MAG: protein kinase [Vicinamibacterales bacterium]
MLPAGTRLGPYELESLIGSGGMGEVYRARDTRLGRTVAIKLLSPDLGRDADFRARLEREARAISQLNHPHICTLHDIGENYLVMEHIEGETLAQLLERGPLPLPRALDFAVQMSDALDKAHRQGIAHGDLKPGNVMVSRQGIKLLDFGLAVDRRSPAPEGWSDTATHTAPVGSAGVVGTLHYLAPEQLEGKPADERTDIFACGAVIYEMVTGRKAFEGSSQAAVIAAIMREAPPPMRQAAPTAPVALERLVSACLAKDPAERWQSAGDLRRQLEWIAAAGPDAAVAPSPRARWAWLATAALAILFLATLAVLLLRQPAGETAPVRTALLLPDGVRFPAANTAGGGVRVAIAPDGRRVAYVAVDANGNTQLWVRALDASQSVPLPGTDGAASPFWSPDSQVIAFTAQGQLKTVPADGGMPVVIAGQSINTTGAWNDEGTILFTPTPVSPLHRVAASGGTPEPVTTLDASRGDTTHRAPVFLPSGRTFLYVATGAPRTGEAAPPRSIHVASLDGTPSRLLVEDASNPLYTNGYLLFARNGTMLRQRFDADGLAVSGQPQPLGEQVEFGGAGAASLSVSNTGTLAFQPAASAGTRLLWFDRSGRQVGVLGDPDQYADVEVSPDGSRAAVTVLDPAVNTRDIWVFDVARGVRSRLTSDRADDLAPIWSGDSSRVLFTSNRSGRFDLYERDASGLGPEQPVYADASDKYPTSWSRDGAAILYWTFNPAGSTLELLRPGASPAVRDFLGSPVSPGRFSPDGRWVAYYSAESGRSEIYVVPFPQASRKWQVSTRGGSFVRWRGDGRELFYISRDNRLMAVDIDTSGGTPRLGAERALFDARPVGPRYFYDVSPDGERVLVNTSRDGSATSSISLVQHWSAALDGE